MSVKAFGLVLKSDTTPLLGKGVAFECRTNVCYRKEFSTRTNPDTGYFSLLCHTLVWQIASKLCHTTNPICLIICNCVVPMPYNHYAMPYARRTRRRRGASRRGRRVVRGRGMTTRQAAFRALSRVDPEMKFHDVNLGSFAIPQAAPFTTQLSLIAAGTTQSTRIGQSCQFLFVQWRCFYTSGATVTPAVIRFMIVVDYQPNNAAYGVGELLDSVTEAIVSHHELDNNRRFKVLKDENFNVGPDLAVVTSRKGYLKIRLNPRYINDQADVPQSVNLTALFASSATGGVATQPTVVARFRIRFVG